MHRTPPRWTRRDLLRALGATGLALPALPSLAPTPARSAEPEAPRRLVVLYLPTGAFVDSFRPLRTGPAWPSTRNLMPLERHRDHITVVSGLRNLLPSERSPFEDTHGGPLAAALTGEDIYASAAVGPHAGASMDQVIARALAGRTVLPSLELTSEGWSSCVEPLPCRWNAFLSYSAFGAPVPRVLDLHEAFERATGAPLGLAPAASAARRASRVRVLDEVTTSSASLAQRLSGSDQATLAAWLDHLRDVRARMAADAAACDANALADFPAGPSAIDVHTRAMLRLIPTALACDRTRVITYMFGAEGGRRVFPHLDLWDEHHFLSHHMGDPVKLEAVDRIVTWQFEQVAALLDDLRATPAEDGTPLLDSTLVVAMGSMSDPDPHDPLNVPVVLAGAKGYLRAGEHVARFDQPLADLNSTLLDWMGLDPVPVGVNGSGPIAALRA